MRGEPVITAAVNWLMGQEHLDPAVVVRRGGRALRGRGDRRPGSLTTFKGLHPVSIEAGLRRNPGIVATAMHCVNAIPYVCEAAPGLVTYLDLPPVAGRAAPLLAKR